MPPTPRPSSEQSGPAIKPVVVPHLRICSLEDKENYILQKCLESPGAPLVVVLEIGQGDSETARKAERWLTVFQLEYATARRSRPEAVLPMMIVWTEEIGLAERQLLTNVGAVVVDRASPKDRELATEEGICKMFKYIGAALVAAPPTQPAAKMPEALNEESIYGGRPTGIRPDDLGQALNDNRCE